MSPDTNHCLIDNHLTRRTPLTIPLRRQKTKRGAVRTNDDIRVVFMLHMDPVKTRGGVQGVPKNTRLTLEADIWGLTARILGKVGPLKKTTCPPSALKKSVSYQHH